MHDAGEPRSVYGNPREQGGLPSFLVLLLTVLGYGLRLATPSFYASTYTVPDPSPPFHRSPRHSHILPFCTFAISAIARRGSRYGVARRPPVVSNDPSISDEIGLGAAGGRGGMP